MKVRLLDLDYYGDAFGSIEPGAIVEATQSKSWSHAVTVSGDEIRGLTGRNEFTSEQEFMFINPTRWNSRTVVMWEPVDESPFAHWNRLKATREAGAMPERL